MVFTSFTFLLFFLPTTLSLYFVTPNMKWRNGVLTLCSLIFYAWGEPIYVIVLLFSAFVDYLHGKWAASARETAHAYIPVLSCVAINLGLLSFFKYSGLLIQTVNELWDLQLTAPKVTLPIGISFYTFQTMSYVIDVAHGRVERQRSWPDFLLYVSLFPQLIAGPIVRYAEVANDLLARTHSLQKVSAGLERFTIGLFKKAFFANIAAELVARTMETPTAELTTLDAWLGAFLYSLQIYFDFSGYSDMAIGLGLIFGFTYPENFRHPYIAKTAQEFWRRWHITLGRFFRDYLYLPLGGRKRLWVRNLFVVWFLTGLWHGASWNFVIWGLYFGVFIWLEGLFLKRFLATLPAVIGHIYLLIVVITSWVFFYFEDLDRALAYLRVMFTGGQSETDGVATTLIIDYFWWLVLACIACLPTRSWVINQLLTRFDTPRLWISITAPFFMIALWVVSLSMLSTTTFNPFIYFRF